MFTTVLIGKSGMAESLLGGAMLASGLIVFACWQLALYKPFADFIRKVHFDIKFSFTTHFVPSPDSTSAIFLGAYLGDSRCHISVHPNRRPSQWVDHSTQRRYKDPCMRSTR